MNNFKTHALASFLLYSQNFIFGFFNKFVFIPSLVEFLLTLSVLALISKSRYYKSLLSIWLVLYFTHFSFMSFFGTPIKPWDAYLFFTHVLESYETFIETLSLYATSFFITLFTLLAILKIDLKRSAINLYVLLVVVVALAFINAPKIGDASFLLIKSLYEASSLKTQNAELNVRDVKRVAPLRKSDVNVVLLIGESMRAKEFHAKSFDIFENYFYKTIYSGATSTDVSVPLLINGAIKPSEMDFSNNLFTLARNNGYETHFISTQSENSMRYIKPYLMTQSVQNYRIIGSKNDDDLVKELKKIDFEDNKTDFVIMQMTGQHSPYKYYPKYKKSTITQQYEESMEYSNVLILEMIKYVKASKRETLFIYTSDHGELLGEDGKMGHNKFQEKIYRVPLVIVPSLKDDVNLSRLQSHSGIYRLIYHFLGYGKEFKEANASIRVNGSMISEEDGYRMMERL